MQELLKALVKAKLDMKSPKKSGFNKFSKTKYSTYDDISECIDRPLASNGLHIDHDFILQDGNYWMVTNLRHVSGDLLSNKIPLFPLKVDNLSQGFAAGITYSKRYAVCCLLSLAGEEDDDGISAGGEKQEPKVTLDPSFQNKINQEESLFKSSRIKDIEKLVNGNADTMSRILEGYKVKSLQEIPTSELPKIINKLNTVNQ